MPEMLYVGLQDDNKVAVFALDGDSGRLTKQAEVRPPAGRRSRQSVQTATHFTSAVLAVMSKICPPPGKMVKTIAVARSEEHVFNLRGGRVNKSGKPIEAPGNSYTLNPTGQPHRAMIATENIALVI